MPTLREERLQRLKGRASRGKNKPKKKKISFGPLVRLWESLENLGYVEVREKGTQVSKDKTKMKIVHRVYDQRSWTPVQCLLRREEKRVSGKWTMFTGIEHILNEDSRSGIGYLWVFMVQGDLEVASNDLCRILDLISSDMVSLPIAGEDRPRRRSKRRNGKRINRRTPPPPSDQGVVMVGGQVLEYPLLAKPNRNKPQVSLFAPAGSRKGAHYLSQD